MVYSNKIEISEGTDINNTSVSKECDVCHYWYILNYSFMFQSTVVIDVMIY